MGEVLVHANASPTPREFRAVAPPANLDLVTATPAPSERPHGSVEAEVRLLAMRVAILVGRVEELSMDNEALRNEMRLLARRSGPSAPYSSVAPKSETVRLPDVSRAETKRPPPR